MGRMGTSGVEGGKGKGGSSTLTKVYRNRGSDLIQLRHISGSLQELIRGSISVKSSRGEGTDGGRRRWKKGKGEFQEAPVKIIHNVLT